MLSESIKPKLIETRSD